jgi:endoglucanase
VRILLAILFAVAAVPTWVRAADRDAFAACKALGRGINLGNALEAPKEGEWGVTLKEGYFTAIKKAGFDSVRLPVKWSAHATKEAPYTIDKTFFERVDWAIEQAKKNNVIIIVNAHHYDEIVKDPDAHMARLAGFWKQISERYKDQPESVYFELLNEPHEKLDDAKWNAEFPKILAMVRKTNPTRPVVIGPSQWSNVNNLANLKLPADDRHLIATFHYYSPFEFTHQGAPWQAGAEKWKGRKWPQNAEEEAKLTKDFTLAAEWGKKEKRPVFLGEFGAFSAADMDQRVRWTTAVRQEAEKHGFAWSYWEFCSGFGAYDPQKDVWHEPLLKALIK